MKRSPLKRSKRLVRRAWLRVSSRLRPNAKTGAYANRPRAVSHMEWVRSQMCMVARAVDELHAVAGCRWPVKHRYLRCNGPIEADHQGDRMQAWGANRRSFDRDTVPMCKFHHGQRTNLTGIFRGFTGEMIRRWCDRAIAITHELARSQGREIPTC